jgi:predicted anti-sigma-YlaC factor YlaD
LVRNVTPVVLSRVGVAYTNFVLIAGTVCIVVYEVTTSDTAGSGAEAVDVTIKVSATAYIYFIGIMRTQYSIRKPLQVWGFEPEDTATVTVAIVGYVTVAVVDGNASTVTMFVIIVFAEVVKGSDVGGEGAGAGTGALVVVGCSVETCTTDVMM